MVEFGMKYDLPNVTAVALTSALRKVAGEHVAAVDKRQIMAFLETLTPAVKDLVVEEMVSYILARDLYRPNVVELRKKLTARMKTGRSGLQQG